MSRIVKIILSVVIALYLIIVVFTTAFLLNRNDYGVSSFLGKYLVFVEEKNLEPKYKEHALLAITPVKGNTLKVGDNAFFYDTYTNEKKIKFNEVTKAEVVNENETTYTLKDNTRVSSQYVLGNEKTTASFNLLGSFLYIVQSRWGFLFIVVFPLFLAFIYEIYSIYKEVKSNK